MVHLVKDLIKNTACLLTWLAPSVELNVYSMLVPVEEGQSEAWDLKVLSEAKMPADLDWTD